MDGGSILDPKSVLYEKFTFPCVWWGRGGGGPGEGGFLDSKSKLFMLFLCGGISDQENLLWTKSSTGSEYVTKLNMNQGSKVPSICAEQNVFGVMELLTLLRLFFACLAKSHDQLPVPIRF